MRLFRLSLAVAPLLVFLTGLRVVVSSKPLHSLVANVMQGVTAPELSLADAQAAQFFNLKPSARRKIHQADIVFWVGVASLLFAASQIFRSA